ncbi:MAG: HNH endonuclease signature motif containing protein [bacterium]
MNYRIHPEYSILLMSTRPGAPYQDEVQESGRVVVYEGHDSPKNTTAADPKSIDQPWTSPGGTPTQNGLFHEAAKGFVEGARLAERVRLYEKLRDGIWVFNGHFRLIDAFVEDSAGRKVFKFLLEITDSEPVAATEVLELEHSRAIPSSVKQSVWKRDNGKCVQCGSQDNLHFDHIIPFSRGGSSLVPENIQLLCARHNLQKHDRIE